ncbi:MULTISPECIES: nitrogenase molybdenum-iron protein subunit beta [unclassified Carboxydocella]|uniref:nitrogenase molybdenum-iron protein subunit beta n=1 Tax=unclassified Carboxydocella TaxID=2685367 RepID=UPI0009AD24A1|nr:MULTISPECIES: nitrogenase molybdenum-iron protein subunit beta [unclassified Carboxydocella]AVX31924.1 Mo-nitrogenase MoFe protein subunit NifK [Carboxydocella thermautotrophica]GAW28513.1 nitrogenase molybdenum-iron protein, alpha and beta chains [Carboxydocella sp. ULO1]GAW32573.1 nitrogenase molybdenum-iron protein, alpha and beta chains [Carboxydocella sp. JDF658]
MKAVNYAVEREALVVNPVKTCQPIGAVYAALGIHGCMPHSHGSQGCASYLRMHLSRHFREPALCTTSSFSEGQVVFGGSANLKQGIKNLVKIYRPQVVAVHTTCSAETIGDDVPGIIAELKKTGEVPEDLIIFSASTPSYVGSHITGFANMIKAAVEALATPGEKNSRINLLPGFVNPGDVREIKRILSLMDIDAIVLPDVSGVLDAPMTGELKLYQDGGTRTEDIKDMANAQVTIALGEEANLLAGEYLEEKFKVPLEVLPVPIGVENTDLFLMTLAKYTGKPIPPELEEERGRLMDMLLDAHAHWYGKRVAIYGDPDLTLALVGMAKTLGLIPAYVVTGTRSDSWQRQVEALTPEARVANGADLFTLHGWIKEEKVDLLLGNTYGKFIAREEKIPLVRVGFPVLDRANLQHFPLVGYRGMAWLAERIGNTLLDWKDMFIEKHRLELVQ